MVFCDTSGLHRGGISTTHARLQGAFMFVTPASVYPRRFVVERDASLAELSPPARYALA
jgi:hypothetical protein